MSDEPLRLRITSDGTPMGTFVRDAETGRELTNVVSVRWRLSVVRGDFGLSTAVIELAHVPVDVQGVLAAPTDQA